VSSTRPCRRRRGQTVESADGDTATRFDLSDKKKDTTARRVGGGQEEELKHIRKETK